MIDSDPSPRTIPTIPAPTRIEVVSTPIWISASTMPANQIRKKRMLPIMRMIVRARWFLKPILTSFFTRNATAAVTTSTISIRTTPGIPLSAKTARYNIFCSSLILYLSAAGAAYIQLRYPLGGAHLYPEP